MKNRSLLGVFGALAALVVAAAVFFFIYLVGRGSGVLVS